MKIATYSGYLLTGTYIQFEFSRYYCRMLLLDAIIDHDATRTVESGSRPKGDVLKQNQEFQYLDSWVTSNGKSDKEIRHPIGMAKTAYRNWKGS